MIPRAIHFRFDHSDPKVFVPTCGIWGNRFHAEVNPPLITNDLSKVTCRMCLRRLGLLHYPMGAQAHKVRRRVPTTLVAYVTAAISKAEVRALTQERTPPFLRAKMAIAAVRRWDRVYKEKTNG
jgi:hypothetical protein